MSSTDRRATRGVAARPRGVEPPGLPARAPRWRPGARRARSAVRLRHRGRRCRPPSLRQQRPVRHARRSSSSRTGRRTSTPTTASTIPTLEEFEKQTGIKVTYNTDINDNNEFFAKVSNQLGDCQPIGRDIIVMTDWMAGRMIELGWIQKLDHANLPNVDANLIAS